MTQPTIHKIPFRDNTLEVLACEIADHLAGAPQGDLSGALVLLPSARACRRLGHVFIEVTGRDTLLLPRALTVRQWTDEMTVAVGLDGENVPDERVRSLILAPHLAALPWLADHPEGAPGLARELLTFFDEARLYQRAELLLEPDGLPDMLARAFVAEAELLADDLGRVHTAWEIYRGLVPRDHIDQLVALAAALASDGPPTVRAPELVVVAGFSHMDPTRAALLRSALEMGQAGRVYVPTATGELAKYFLTSWGAEAAPTDPLAPSRAVVELLTGTAGAERSPGLPTLRARLDQLAAVTVPGQFLAPTGPLEMAPCGGPEIESCLVAERVAQLQHAASGPLPHVVIAVADPRLAVRIRGQLQTAGIEADFTHGEPLSALPAGLLVRFLLRAALTDLRIEPLLEVLTHPYVKLPSIDGSHGVWILRLEQMYRRDKGPRGGLGGLFCVAEERDAATLNLIRDYRPEVAAGMVAFVTGIADAFAPLLPFVGGAQHSWREMLTAVRACWALLAADHTLNITDTTRADTNRLAVLLADLARDQDLLPPLTLAEFSTELGRLMSAENAASHRKPHLPVVITGLVEARMERCDMLIVAGLREGIFPARTPRPLFLTGALRKDLGLPNWSEALARDAELMARLLHAAPRVLLTWSTENEGAPALPSPFVWRLQLVLQTKHETVGAVVPWRAKAAPAAAIVTAEDTFRSASPVVKAMAPIRPLTNLSWSALRKWRDCAYRHLVERGYALRREEEVQAEFQAMDYGNLVHQSLHDWLDPMGEGYAALCDGDAAAALVSLDAAAAQVFEPGLDVVPQRRLWFENFRRLMADIVRVETARFTQWRPLALEQQFSLPLPVLRDWAASVATAGEVPTLPPHGTGVVLRGAIDRVDRCVDGTGALAVIDYKTGSVPTRKSVTDLEELQILLYALAVERGVVDLPGPTVRGVREGFYYGVRAHSIGAPAKLHFVGDVEDGAQLLHAAAVELVAMAVAAANPAGEFVVLPREIAGTGPAKLPCGYCDLRGVCRVEELTVPPGTARKLDKMVNRKAVT